MLSAPRYTQFPLPDLLVRLARKVLEGDTISRPKALLCAAKPKLTDVA
jgi:hypothetical protein